MMTIFGIFLAAIVKMVNTLSVMVDPDAISKILKDIATVISTIASICQIIQMAQQLRLM